MTAAGALALGRESLERQAWADAYAQLVAADHQAPLALEDLERLATAAYLAGREATAPIFGLVRIASACASATYHERLGAPSGWAWHFL